MPDDPKGALRWSLSKLRGLLGKAVVADRETAWLDLAKLEVDWHVLRAAPRVLSRASPVDLDRLARKRGEFLEGLELANCDSFSAWVIAQRGDVRAWQAAVCAELTGRDLPPDDLLPHARAWTELDPAGAEAAATLVRLLDAAGRSTEAEQQRDLSVRRLQEGGAHVPTELRSVGAAREAGEAEPLVQSVRFCSASDGTRLAYSVVGDGPPLVKVANWLNHLEFDFDSPVWRHWIAGFAEERSLLRYDERGNGLSDWHAELGFEAFVDDLESVVDAAGLDRFDMFGISQGGERRHGLCGTSSGARAPADHLWRLCGRLADAGLAVGDCAAPGHARSHPGGLGARQSRLPADVHLALPALWDARAAELVQ